MTESAVAELIDLIALGRRCVPLADWWERLVATGQGDAAELERVADGLKDLLPQPGRVGRAIEVITSRGSGASDDEVLAAVGLLCALAARASGVLPPPTGSRRRHRRRGAGEGQAVLPGFGSIEPQDATPPPRARR